MAEVTEIDAKDALQATRTIMLSTKADAVATDTTSAWSPNSVLKGILKALGFNADAAIALYSTSGNISQILRGMWRDAELAKTTSTSTAITRPAASLSNQTFLSALATRNGFIIVSEMGSGIAYIKLGATATISSYSIILLPGQIFNSQVLGCNYTGRVDCICDTLSGQFQITSLEA